MAGANYKLDNLCAVLDRNRLQISGTTEEVMALDNLKAKWSAFGWHVVDVKDGNSVEELSKAFEEARNTKSQPTLVLANTVKGKGSPVMENKAGWHHHVPNAEEYAQIMADLKAREEEA